MIKIILHGCNGRMGQVITRLAKNDDKVVIVAGVDPFDDGHNDYPVYSSLEACKVKADVVVDFSNAAVTDDLIKNCMREKLPVVLCTTGLSEAQLEMVMEASGKIPVLRSANMSLGINLLMELLGKAASVLAEEGFDIEIVEKHHRHKLDAPSGTALALADAMNETLGGAYSYETNRASKREERPDQVIGISAVRGGTITGEHEVIFAGMDEVITFSHTAYSREIFAKGALAAAKFLAGQDAGLYNMSDVIRTK